MIQLKLKPELAIRTFFAAGLILLSMIPAGAKSTDGWPAALKRPDLVVAQASGDSLQGGVSHDSERQQPPGYSRAPRQRRSRRGRRGGRGLYGASLDLRPLNLSEAQKERIRDIRRKSRLKAREYRKELKVKKIAMQNMMFSPDATPVQIRSAAKEFQTAQANMQDTVLGDFLGVRAVLTRQQLQMLPEIKPQRGSGGPGHPRRHPGMAAPGQQPPAMMGGQGNTGWQPPYPRGFGRQGMGGPGRPWGRRYRGEPPPWRTDRLDGASPGSFDQGY